MNKFTISIHSPIELPHNSSLAIGFFDGLHLGHQRLFDCLKAEKETYQYTPCILSFVRNFKSNLKHQKEELILLEKERDEILASFQIENEYVLPFDEETINTSTEDFITFLKALKPKSIVVGKDFTFGKSGLGKASDLLVLEKDNIHVHIIDLLSNYKEKISTKSLLSLLKEGKIKETNIQLGYDFFIEGDVIYGLQNGTKIGFPTINIKYPEHKVELPNGVYKTYVVIDNQKFISMTDIGTHPTIDPLKERIIETHILHYRGNLYGKHIRIHFLDYMRPEIKFTSLTELVTQLKKDVEECENEDF